MFHVSLGTITAKVGDAYEQTLPAEVTNGETTTVHFVRAPGSAALQGWVTLHGHAAQQAGLFLTVDAPEESLSYRHETDATGHFELKELPAGNARLTVTATNRDKKSVSRHLEIELIAGETVEISVSFDGQGGILGQVHGIDTEHDSLVMVLAGRLELPRHPSKRELGDLRRRHAIMEMDCADDGSFRCESLDAGWYTLLARNGPIHKSLGPTRFASYAVSIEDDEVVQADISF